MQLAPLATAHVHHCCATTPARLPVVQATDLETGEAHLAKFQSMGECLDAVSAIPCSTWTCTCAGMAFWLAVCLASHTRPLCLTTAAHVHLCSLQIPGAVGGRPHGQGCTQAGRSAHAAAAGRLHSDGVPHVAGAGAVSHALGGIAGRGTTDSHTSRCLAGGAGAEMLPMSVNCLLGPCVEGGLEPCQSEALHIEQK